MLGRAWAMEWVSRVIFLEAAICVAGNLSAYMGRGYPRQCIYKEGIGVAFKQPVIILHTCNHSERCQHGQYVWNGPMKSRQI